MPTTPQLIKAVFVAHAAAIPGVVTALGHEPKTLPKMPAVTMLPLVPGQTDVETGPGTDVTWAWRVHLYLQLRDYERAEEQLLELGPELLAITRRDPTLDDTCELPTLTVQDEEPVFNHDEGWMLARFRLTAITTET